MNKVICLMLVLLSFAISFAQEKTIDESEFNAVYNKSKEKRENNSYRMKTVFQNTVEGKPDSTNSGTVVMEVSAPGTSRIVLQTNSKSENKERERITVKDKVYTRDGKAAWKQESSGERPPENRTSTGESNAEYKFLGNETLNNQNATVYQKTETRKRIREKDKKEITADVTVKYWFGTDGDLLKVEQTATVHIGDEILHNTMTRTFEFDPNIKIEMPQVAGAEKQ